MDYSITKTMQNANLMPTLNNATRWDYTVKLISESYKNITNNVV